jgi:MoaA/NifB/PqqE/SkfB family radical SAM enzyme
MHRLDEIAAVVGKMKARMWSVFFLVVTGRALAGDDLTDEEYEQVFEKLHEISKWAPFEVKATEAMHYRLPRSPPRRTATTGFAANRLAHCRR